jgi:predicted ester cyclase
LRASASALSKSRAGEAYEEAAQTVGEIIQGNGVSSWTGSDEHMEVTDAAGQAVPKLRFSLEELIGEAPSFR